MAPSAGFPPLPPVPAIAPVPPFPALPIKQRGKRVRLIQFVGRNRKRRFPNTRHISRLADQNKVLAQRLGMLQQRLDAHESGASGSSAEPDAAGERAANRELTRSR